ncbi:Nuclear export mediator factor Nemf [Bienertia sinuspersici]
MERAYPRKETKDWRKKRENRVVTLRKEVEYSVKMAQLIEYNLEDVDAAILAVRVALANGMNWEDLARMVKLEKKSGNPVAGLIDTLHLERNCMTLLLSNNLDEMDDDEKTLPADKVEVDISLSAHGNARRWYETKKKQESKQEKTVTAHEKAFKAAERKTRLQLSKEKSVATISHIRKVHWFEKFNWFISSENYLVISGRDAQQNEMIVKRYMSKGDLYVHAELHGASSTVIKNHKPEQPVCLSQAWDSKIVTSAWWVYPHQVSKSAPTGEYLTVGSFMIRGKKNFLPPHPLVMGFGMLFRLDESSLGLHLNERRVRGEDEASNVLQENGNMELSDSNSEIKEQIIEKDESSMPSGTITHSAHLGGLSSYQSAEDSNNSFPKAEDLAETGTESNSASSILDSGAKEKASVSVELEDLIDRALELGSGAVSNRSYEQTFQLTESDECTTQEKNVLVKDKPHISKAERRKLKKGQNTGDGQTTNVQGDVNEGNSSTMQLEKDTLSTAGGKVARGKRGKLKKMKEKYADQDEEERSIRMALLASAGKALDDKNETGAQDQIAATSSKKEFNDAIVVSEMEQMAMEEDDIHEIGEEEKGKLNDVDYLTGNPLPNDVLLYAVPVCGPYSALQPYKYRVKIIPGTAKKGKAAKTAMNLFNHMPEASTREKELMKACTDPELVAAMIGNSKITAAGLTQLKQKQKKGKKASSKAGS